jgi:amidase
MYGSPLGVGTDIAGSVRSPAAYNGLYGLRTTMLRLPMLGVRCFDAGQISIYSCIGPLARSLRDCELFMRTILAAQPWLDDPSALRMPWRWDETILPEKLTVGVIRWDEYVMVHPPISRALNIMVESLRKEGHEVIEWRAAEHGKVSMDILAPLFYPTGAKEVFDLIEGAGEPWTPAITRNIRDSPVTRDLRNSFTVKQNWEYNVKRDQYRLAYARRWQESGKLTKSGRKIDCIIAPAGTSVSFPHNFNR